MSMMKRERSAEERTITKLTVQLPQHVVRDMQTMEKNTGRSVDDLTMTALLMFISTHNDFLGKRNPV